MKKLMIAAAIVCVAAISQASTFTWGSTQGSKIYAYDWNDVGVAPTGYVEFFVNGDFVTRSSNFDADGYATFSGVTLNSANPSLGTPDDVVKAVAHITNFADGEGTIEWTFTFTDAWYLPQPGDTEATMAMINSLNTRIDGTAGGLNLAESAAYNGYTAAPEPTSGLLLLLGVAGLALRRRRA